MFKKYYIESKLRFTIFIVLMSLIIIMSISAIFHNVYAEGKGSVAKTYYAVTVESGDTLWSLAQKYSDGRSDIRKFIYEIADINGLETSDINVGQQLLIPA